MIDMPIGKPFEFKQADGKILMLKAVKNEDGRCHGCVFFDQLYTDDGCHDHPLCGKYIRKDGENVIFIKVRT